MKHNLLAIDASTEALSLALYFEGNTFTHFEVCPQQHSQKILPLVDALLSKANCTLQQLDGIVYGRGPGSFTGVRIGVAVAQGLAYSAGLKLSGISTLQAMAHEAIKEKGCNEVISAIDARMGEIYLGHFIKDAQGNAVAKQNEIVIKPDTITGDFNGVSGVGTGWQTYSDDAKRLNVSTIDSISLPNAAYMLELGDIAFATGDTVSAQDAQPHYVRDTVTWKKLPGRE
ncbi:MULTISPECIES: tRNA (adenosine(37)-N6)-threonylcarbamoyltransferase complex dimerization subunit type 1 TsaB [Pseudoalteromonas]|uniref:tRNA threonylcarbamoyladenosine biosynthesis protein TsaB n=1 Tax=Pseudoalteromonas obscura TaxID=3048491 RepID=A0ABT7ER28_9GAMM|nr:MULTISPECIES: tRNA (adenosine(37)-N6)-threonylcarbamoyltransferase complex dimerization subunit type 1 TsaB [Pseudoalteromonas]MBQ4835132.1 tRNA (adenosine(37)-N6)-threonylcarbamoyltransferase complex dimerization subunit type 1 TsaB [Pseudoalteromonas luteoviolacea]MDK2597425.1 tRNA (adenosine(37)-N6)-threonylcarbamoyltransferase complex dimerization subunit type 1 TsaB [Pseudoalteromonas sp. P94(2023)]